MSFGQTRQDLDVDSIRPWVQDLFASAAARSPRESAGFKVWALCTILELRIRALFGTSGLGFV